MDGLHDTVPLGKPYEEFRQMTFSGVVSDSAEQEEPEAIPCKFFNWRRKSSLVFKKLKEN